MSVIVIKLINLHCPSFEVSSSFRKLFCEVRKSTWKERIDVAVIQSHDANIARKHSTPQTQTHAANKEGIHSKTQAKLSTPPPIQLNITPQTQSHAANKKRFHSKTHAELSTPPPIQLNTTPQTQSHAAKPIHQHAANSKPPLPTSFFIGCSTVRVE